MKQLFTIAICFFMFLIGNGFAQDDSNDLTSTLSKMTQDASTAYLAPVVSAFGADLNSGWIHGVVPAKKMGFDFELRFIGMGTFFSDANKTFSANGSFRFNRSEAEQLTSNINNNSARQAIINQIIATDFNVGMSGPTITGKKSDFVSVEFQGQNFSYNGQSYSVPAQKIATEINGVLDDLPLLPLAAPQITVGTIYGTQLSIRYLPDIELDPTLGKLSFFGIGVQHNPAAWLDMQLPLDLSVGLFTQSMSVGDIFKSSAFLFNINASKTFGSSLFAVTPYTSLGFESSSIDINYKQSIDTQSGPQELNVSYNQTGENSVRFTIGASFKLTVLSINLDYNLAKYNTASAGFGFAF